MKMTGDFYVVFYDRGAAPIGAVEVADSGNSYLFNGAEYFPARIPLTAIPMRPLDITG